jgi:predicted AAA+ superfamily ATPase
MWQRLAQARLENLFNQFPAVLILGARQVGKTTLAHQTFPDFPYCDLEEPNAANSLSTILPSKLSSERGRV